MRRSAVVSSMELLEGGGGLKGVRIGVVGTGDWGWPVGYSVDRMGVPDAVEVRESTGAEGGGGRGENTFNRERGGREGVVRMVKGVSNISKAGGRAVLLFTVMLPLALLSSEWLFPCICRI